MIPLILTQSVLASQIKLAWDPNEEADLAGYKVYFGTASGAYGPPIDVGNITKFTLPGFSPGHIYYFAVTAYDTSDNESGFSNEVSGLPSEHFKGLVTKYYNDVLDRNPEPGGAESWSAEIERIASYEIDFKEGFLTAAEIFFSSEEYLQKNKSNSEFITDLYQTFLGRLPDQGGMNSWLNYLAQGLTRGMLITHFGRSDEFKLYIDQLLGSGISWPENDLINDLYRGFFTRLPDAAGFNYWLILMRNAQCTGGQEVRNLAHQIALEFMWSQEYLSRNRDDSEFTEDLYDGILRRGASSSEVSYWVNLLYNGTYNREQVLQYFTDSPEFQIRVQEVINAGCVH